MAAAIHIKKSHRSLGSGFEAQKRLHSICTCRSDAGDAVLLAPR